MKYVIIGDMHGYDVNRYNHILNQINPDVLILLNDCDLPFSLHQSQAISEEFKQRGREVISIPGNHDIAHHKKTPITSGLYKILNTNFDQIQKELKQDDKATEYLRKLCEEHPRRVSFSLDEELTDFTAVTMHAAYGGELHGAHHADPTLWARLESTKDYELNFEAMKERGYRLLIRGHDHRPWYTYKDPEKGIKHYEARPWQSTFRLFPHRQHIITAGALCHGQIASIDTTKDVPILKYHWII